MSGIAASFGTIDNEDAQHVLDRLAHRVGPEEGELRMSGSWIGSRYSPRLGPDQPLRSKDGRYAMVVDGELYGSPKADLPVEWVDVINEYASSGADVLNKLAGDFALVILDENGDMLAARDCLGIKPLYWAQKGDTVRFASEVRSFDRDWLPDVEFFPPGHYWTPKQGLVRFAPDIREQVPTLLEEGEPSEFLASLHKRIRESLVESVHREIKNDPSVVSFLSGGLDSSLIAAIANQWMKERGKTLKTFAVGLEHSPDMKAAREVAEYLGTDHTEVTYTDEQALEIVPEVVEALENFDPTLVRSSVANYMLADVVARDVDVVLTGEGADELFAGYRYLREIESDEELDQELRELLAGLHQSGLQRVDRTSMAHGLEARMPFLTNEMIDLGMSIPAALKRADDTHPEKQLLREAFRGWLPDEILWRKKAQFGEGSGAIDALRREVSSDISEDELESSKDAVDPELRTREELAYYRMFADALPGARAEAIVGRFATA